MAGPPTVALKYTVPGWRDRDAPCCRSLFAVLPLLTNRVSLPSWLRHALRCCGASALVAGFTGPSWATPITLEWVTTRLPDANVFAARFVSVEAGIDMPDGVSPSSGYAFSLQQFYAQAAVASADVPALSFSMRVRWNDAGGVERTDVEAVSIAPPAFGPDGGQ
jgi:hypothetical protein